MKTSTLLTLAVLCGTLLSGGCCSEKNTPTPAPRPVKMPVKQNKPTEVKTISFSVGDEVKAKLRFQVLLDGENKKFSAALFQLISDDLLSGVEVGRFPSYDGYIRLGNKFEIKDKTGEYVRVICKGISVSVVCYNQLKVARKITLRPMPRKLGADNAFEQYLQPAAKEICKFLSNKLNKLNNEMLAVSEVTVRINDGSRMNSQAFSREVKKVSAAVASINGVIKYQVVSQDMQPGVCTFRIVYTKDKLPHGVRNELNSKLK